MIDRILVPYDDSSPAHRALEYAVSVFSDRELTLLSVVDLPSQYRYGGEFDFALPQEEHLEYQRDRVSRMLGEAVESVGPVECDLVPVVEVGRPSTVIVDYARSDGVDQIVMGSHGRTGVSRFLFGSVAEAVIRRSEIPVVVVP